MQKNNLNKIVLFFLIGSLFLEADYLKAKAEPSKKPLQANEKKNKEQKNDSLSKDKPSEKVKDLVTDEKESLFENKKKQDQPLEQASKDDSKKNKKLEEGTSVQKFATVRIENESFKTFADFIHNLKELNYIPNEDLNKANVSLTLAKESSLDDVYEAFLKVLSDKGFAHVQVGDLYKIVKKESQYTEAIPPIMGKPSAELPDSDRTVRFITFLKNLSVGDIDPILKAFLSPGAPYIPLTNFNGLVITDRCLNIKYLMKVLNELDNAGYQEVISLIKLKETNVVDVKNFLEKFISKNDGASTLARLLSGSVESSAQYFPSNIKIIAEERTNTLILLGTASSLRRVEDFVVNFVDKKSEELDTPFDIYECQNVDADNLKKILDEITRPSDSGAGKYGGVKGGMKFFNTVKVESDSVGNRLIIYCADKHDREIIWDTLLQLDKQVPQVFIDTLIIEIDNSDSKGISGQIRNRSFGNPIPGVNFQTTGITQVPVLTQEGNNMVSLLANLVKDTGAMQSLGLGSTFLSFGPKDDIWALLSVLSTQVHVSIISQPTITVANRATGRVSTDLTKRVDSETAISVSGTPSLVGKTDAHAKTEISYTPQINQDGLVNLKVSINISDFVASSENTRDKNLETSVTLANGQVLVMGGFVKTKTTESAIRSPLANIPFLGHFFKAKGRSEDKQYTFIFVRTNVYKPRSSPGIGPVTKMRLHDARDAVADAVDSEWGRDPIENRFFNGSKENMYHKVVDYANARYQPTTVDLRRDPMYRSTVFGRNRRREKQSGDESEAAIFNPEANYSVKTHVDIVSPKIFNGKVVRLGEDDLSASLNKDVKREERTKNFYQSEQKLIEAFEKEKTKRHKSFDLAESKLNFSKYLDHSDQKPSKSSESLLSMLKDNEPEIGQKRIYNNLSQDRASFKNLFVDEFDNNENYPLKKEISSRSKEKFLDIFDDDIDVKNIVRNESSQPKPNYDTAKKNFSMELLSESSQKEQPTEQKLKSVDSSTAAKERMLKNLLEDGVVEKNNYQQTELKTKNKLRDFLQQDEIDERET